MLKRSALRRICVASLALLITGIIYFFPDQKVNYDFKTEYKYIDTVNAIYLLDKNQYVARTSTILKSKDLLEQAKEIINLLTENTNYDYISLGFTKLIPKDTKVLEISLKEKLLKINFSKEFFNLNKNNEEKCIEALIFSLTELDGIKEIMLFVEGEKILKMPKSGLQLPLTLDKSFGINKVYNLSELKNSKKTITYYVSKLDDYNYYVPVTLISNNPKEKIEIIIEELKGSPTHQTNLISYLKASTELLEYQILEDSIKLSFNNHLFDDFKDKNILEEVKYSIYLSVRDSYDVKEVMFDVNGELIESFKT